MPSFVALIALLSLLSFLYSLKLFGYEARRLRMLIQPFGGGLASFMEQVMRLGLAIMMSSLALFSVMMSAALVWLSLQPGVMG